MKFLLLIVLVLLPIDWFWPTGEILREAGAKPFNVFILILGGLLIMIGKPVLLARTRAPIQIALLIFLIYGSLAFFISFLIVPENIYTDRLPLVQFLAQASMIMLFMFVLQTLVYIFSNEANRVLVVKVLPVAAVVHLFFYLLETFGFAEENFYGVFSLFRTDLLLGNASGLMSEPSYYGTFAALFAVPLLFINFGNQLFNRILAISLIYSALVVGSSTMIVVFFVQSLYLLFSLKTSSQGRIFIWAIFTFLSGIWFLGAASDNELDLVENLSTAMRIGSGILALNVALSGYGVLGVGFGQFHFLYTSEFAPAFLMLSQEALNQMYGISEIRASTYNLPLRVLVEAGLPGIGLFLWLALSLLLVTRHSSDTATVVGMCFVSGSIGFLLTQDSYCLPSLAFGLALALTEPRHSPCK